MMVERGSQKKQIDEKGFKCANDDDDMVSSRPFKHALIIIMIYN